MEQGVITTLLPWTGLTGNHVKIRCTIGKRQNKASSMTQFGQAPATTLYAAEDPKLVGYEEVNFDPANVFLPHNNMCFGFSGTVGSDLCK